MNICMNLNQGETKKITSPRDLAEYIIKNTGSEEKMSDEDRTKMDARIMEKLKSGKKLSQKELEYLRKTNPVMYTHAMRVQRMAEAVEEQLKHAKSKEEADRIVSSAINGISKNDPDKEFITAAVNRINMEFHKSGAYDKLPDTGEEANHGRDQISGDVFSDGEEDEDTDGFDLRNWSPLTEVYNSIPTFSAGA